MVSVLNTWNYFVATNRSGDDLDAFSLSLSFFNSVSLFLSPTPLPSLVDLIYSFPCLLLIVAFILVLYWLPRTHSETSESVLTIPLRCSSAVWFIHGSLSAWLLFVFFYSFFEMVSHTKATNKRQTWNPAQIKSASILHMYIQYYVTYIGVIGASLCDMLSLSLNFFTFSFSWGGKNLHWRLGMPFRTTFLRKT